MSPRRRGRPAPRATPLPVPLPMPTGWARERIAAGRALGELPDYGSTAWAALPDEDPRKLAAALIYAEVARYEEATLADRLARELAEARRLAAEETEQQEAAYRRQIADEGAAQILGRRLTVADVFERHGMPEEAARVAAQRGRGDAYLAAHPWAHARRARPRAS